MKITPVFLVVFPLTLLAASPVHAQTTEIALYADRFGTDCSVTDKVGEVAVYMFHVGTGTRTAASFRAPIPACWVGATWSGDELNPATIYAAGGGTQREFFDVIYNGCLPLPIYIGKMLVDATGAAEPCCVLRVLPTLYDAAYGTDCFGVRHLAQGGSVVINEDASCPCSPPLALEETTWGRVKSLYN